MRHDTVEVLRECFLFHRRDGTNAPALDRVRDRLAHGAMPVPEGDGAERHDAVEVLASVVATDPAPVAGDHAQGPRPRRVPEERCGTLASGRGGAGYSRHERTPSPAQ
jgi:hypothetical protein